MKASLRILLVDDNPFFLDAAREFLQLHHVFEVIGTATDSGTAVELAVKLQPDVILLDLNLAEESAITLIPVLRERLPGSRIVVVTIMEGQEYEELVLQSGADAFVGKRTLTQTLIPRIVDLYERPKKFPASPN